MAVDRRQRTAPGGGEGRGRAGRGNRRPSAHSGPQAGTDPAVASDDRRQ